jgi:5-oxoprolinase (ATP-hydrolysing)/N-methylhydantoinase A
MQTAWGIFAIVCENMASAARLYLIERGLDPRRFALMGFGGAGPATVARVARQLGMRQAMIPPASGLASALGLLVAPPGFEFGHSLAGELTDLAWDDVEGLMRKMEEEGRGMVAAAGVPADRVSVERRGEMRYAGQFHDIDVPLPERLSADATPTVTARFAEEYVRRYGTTLEGYAVQALNWRVLVTGPAPRVDLGGSFGAGESSGRAFKGRRKIYQPDRRELVEVNVYDRYALSSRDVVDGPAVIEEAEATTVLWELDRARSDAHGNLVIDITARETDA